MGVIERRDAVFRAVGLTKLYRMATDAVGLPSHAPMRLDAGSGRGFDARVRLIEPQAFTKISPLGVEEQRVKVIGDFVGTAPDLGDAFRVDASIELWSSADVLKVPAGAVFRSNDGWAVFTIDDNRVRKRVVVVGHRNPDEAEIVSGLGAGDEVVVYPSDKLKDGVRVTRMAEERHVPRGI